MPAQPITTDHLITEINLFLNLPVTRLREHVRTVGPKLIAHLRAQDQEIERLTVFRA